jgi:membrane protein DedA with SNARE-associated domain
VIHGLELLEHYYMIIVPGLMVAEQFGLPMPAVPALLGVGALAARGRVNVALLLGVMATVALAVDFVWYELGRRWGASILARLFRLCWKPDSCAQLTAKVAARHGVRVLLVAKFVPGLTTVTPPLAGMFGVPRARFAGYELAGVLLWAGTWLGLGYLFDDTISLLAARVAALGRLLAVVVALALVGYAGFRALRWCRRRALERPYDAGRTEGAVVRPNVSRTTYPGMARGMSGSVDGHRRHRASGDDR